MSTYSSRYVVGQPTDVGGWPGAPPKCSASTSPWRCAASQHRPPDALAVAAPTERTGSSTWTKPGCSAARSISSTASRRLAARDDDRAAQPRLALQPLLDEPAVGGRRERRGGVGVLDGLRRRTGRPGSRPRRPTGRARARARASTLPAGAVLGRRGPAAGWSRRPAGRRCRSARGTASSARPRASAGSSQGKSCSMDVDRRVDVAVDDGRAAWQRRRAATGGAPPRSRSRAGRGLRAVGHRDVQDVALGVVERAVAVPLRLDDVGAPTRRPPGRARRSPPRGRRRRRRTTRCRPARRRARDASASSPPTSIR